MQSETLIQQLIAQTRQIINEVEKLKDLDLQTLTWRNDATSWNMLECLQHLNLYGDFYLPCLQHEISKSRSQPDAQFSSGFLGGYFSRSMLPKDKLNKMKTFKDKDPLNTPLGKTVIDQFLKQQFTLLDLLTQSQQVSLNTVRIPTSISSLIRLRLGDTFQFLINHILRHLAQVRRIQTQLKLASQPIAATMV